MDINNIESFTSIEEDGTEIEYKIILNFECEELNKFYIAYTDESMDEDGDLRILVSSYDPELEELVLEKIETAEECQLVDAVLKDAFGDME